ncbi:MAG: phosphate signaling complex protein PhoU [candidate division FCPU426 bacterium]
MSWHLMKEVERLRKQILTLCSLVEQSVEKAVLSVSRRDERLAMEVVRDDDQIDQMEVDVEEECLKILALHQPVAADLRYVVAILKINNDLERIGDLAVNIAEQAVYFTQAPPLNMPYDYAGMAAKVRAMLRHSLDAMINLDENLAQCVLTSDDEVDKLHAEMYGLVQDSIRKQPEYMDLFIRMLSVSKNLERIADYATNIAEDVVYMIRGKIVRHHCQEPGKPQS